MFCWKKLLITWISVGSLSLVTHAQQMNDERKELRANEIHRYKTLARKLSQSSSAKPTIDVRYYKIELRIHSAPGYLQGKTTILASVIEPSISTITLDFSNTMSIDSVLVDGVAAKIVPSVSAFDITLPRSYTNGEQPSIVVWYHGSPVGTGMGSYADIEGTDGTRWIYTLSEPYGASDWWPCIDYPADKADSLDVWTTCDQTYTAVSQGKLIETIQNIDSTKTFKWRHRYPIASYLISIDVGVFDTFSDWYRYSTADSMEVVNYIQPGIETVNPGYRASAALTLRMLEIYSSLFGQYPFIKEKYGHAEFGWGGGMEHQTITSLGTYAFSESTIAHELAHQWFGDLITCRTWPDIWLNEGFATFCEAVYREKQYGFLSYNSRIGEMALGAKYAIGTLYVQDTADVGNLFDGSRVYDKGAYVLHMLRHVLGDSVFFRSLRSYATDPQLMYGTASTEDFRSVCERVSGKTLGYFFDEWVYGERYPKYSYSLSTVPQGQNFLSTVRIQQSTGTSNPVYFTMPIDLRFFGPGLDTTITVTNNSIDQLFSCITRVRPDSVQLDDKNWILKDVQQVPAGVNIAQNTPRSTFLYQNYPNPFNPITEINFQIARAGFVTLKVYDVLGREAAVIAGAKLEPGFYSRRWNASEMPSGVYIYRLSVVPTDSHNGQVDEILETRKMVLLK